MTENDLLQLAQALNVRGEPYAIVTVVRAIAPTSAYVGAQAIVLGDGTLHGWIGGGCAKSVVVNAAREAMTTGLPKLVRISNQVAAEAGGDVDVHSMPCASNGEIELFIQPHAPAPLMLILGETPVAVEARWLAGEIGFRVIDRADGAAPQIVLVATQGDGDEAALQTALTGSAQRVLLIASHRKAEKLREAMRLRGISEEHLARLEAPAGPDIGATTPVEIALAALAGAVAWRRSNANQAASPGAEARTPAALGEPVPRHLPANRYVNPVCGIAVDPSHAMHTVTYEGMQFYFCCDGCKVEFDRDPAKYAAIQAGAREAPTASIIGMTP